MLEPVLEKHRRRRFSMPKCSYCGKQYEPPRGLTLVMNDGTLKHLCSSKCRKNMLMRRRKTRWISKKGKTQGHEKTSA